MPTIFPGSVLPRANIRIALGHAELLPVSSAVLLMMLSRTSRAISEVSTATVFGTAMGTAIGEAIERTVKKEMVRNFMMKVSGGSIYGEKFEMG